jgi:hypothetical protein
VGRINNSLYNSRNSILPPIRYVARTTIYVKLDQCKSSLHPFLVLLRVRAGAEVKGHPVHERFEGSPMIVCIVGREGGVRLRSLLEATTLPAL